MAEYYVAVPALDVLPAGAAVNRDYNGETHGVGQRIATVTEYKPALLDQSRNISLKRKEIVIMSVTVHVEYQYCQYGKKAVQTGNDLVTVSVNTNSAILAVLRLLHPHWESIKLLSTSPTTSSATTPGN
ncbi:hypothetical protein WN982_22245 [Paraburkholderia sp. IMGN_8]|uniref:hypothetical protein n=1 Tax=Paraburkholderia sp. IMGN_8 TaxID=3136564 RepID=UPI0031017F66